MSTGRTSFLTMSTRRAWPGRVKWIRAGRKEALSRREAFDDTWTREGLAHVYLKRRILVATFNFLGWGVFVDEEVGPRRRVARVGQARERPKPSRGARIAAPHK